MMHLLEASAFELKVHRQLKTMINAASAWSSSFYQLSLYLFILKIEH